MEFWDIYDIHREKTGAVIARCRADELPEGSPYRAAMDERDKLALREGEYHLSVHVWFLNSRGELLLQQRAWTRGHLPGVWAVCGGAVMAGEDSLTAAVRESREEMGIQVLPQQLTRLLTYTSPERHSHMDVYVCSCECDPSELTLQREEVEQAAWFAPEALTGVRLTDERFRRYTYTDILTNFIASREKRCGTVFPLPTHPRGKHVPQAQTVDVWFIGQDGRVLMQRRSMRCAMHPGAFAASGGAVLHAETPMQAAKRVVQSALGLALDETQVFRLCEYLGDDFLCTVYVATQEIRSEEMKLGEEVASVEFINEDMLGRHMDSDNFVNPCYLPMIISAMRALEKR